MDLISGYTNRKLEGMKNPVKTYKTKNPILSNRVLSGSGDEWIRTTDTRIFSPMLYQLSYITLLFPLRWHKGKQK
jgi:hypothetical protein